VTTLRKTLKLSAVATALIFMAACSEDSTTPTPPELDAQFLGYSDPTTKQTTCGNCHVEKQNAWETTRHASAWNDLQASGHAAGYCQPCHTVSGYGNAQPDDAGFPAVDTAAQKFYYDVQCESCHGAGAPHVAGPESVQPISTINADTGTTTGCAVCHNGSHHPFVEEWRLSRHGISDPHMNTNASCVGCHEGRGAIARFDPDAIYLEKTAGPPQAIVCATCHDPHGSDNPADLRRAVDDKDPANNICMSCHLYRTAPTTGSSRSNQPHGPQGGVLIGTAGWLPPGFTYDTSLIETSHGSTGNPGLCAGCHVSAYAVTDAASGAFLMNATGHRFLAIPCLDANGAPDSTQACGHDAAGLSQRRFAGCAVSGCHSTEAAARGAFLAGKTSTDNYIRTLWIDVDGDMVIDAFPADSGLLPKVKELFPTGPTAINPSDATISVGDGAEFNTRMFGGHALHGHPDGSYGAHNPFYYEALLIATINAVRSSYGLPAPPAERTLFASRMARLGMTRR
jgi:predicted CXXCH cytochrome family protein